MKRFLYRTYDASGVLLYVGQCKNVWIRMRGHSTESPWYSKVVMLKIQPFDSLKDALRAERMAIANEKPKFNLVHSLANEFTLRPNLKHKAKSESAMIVGRNIRNARKCAGLSQEDLCGLVGISKPTLIAYEHGVRIPSIPCLRKLATEIGLSIADLDPDAKGFAA